MNRWIAAVVLLATFDTIMLVTVGVMWAVGR